MAITQQTHGRPTTDPAPPSRTDWPKICEQLLIRLNDASTPESSGFLKLNKVDMRKLGMSFLLSLAGFSLVWATDVAIPAVDWSSQPWGLLVGAIAPFVVNALRKLLQDTR